MEYCRHPTQNLSQRSNIMTEVESREYTALSKEELIEAAFEYAQRFVELWGYFPHVAHWNMSMLGSPCGVQRLYSTFGSYFSFKNYCYRRGLRIDNNSRKGWVIHTLRKAGIDPHLPNTLQGKSTFGWSDVQDLLKDLGFKAPGGLATT